MNPFRERKLPRNDNWLNAVRKDILESYIKYKEPWKQAGFIMQQDEWDICQKPVAECIDKSGAFLDIGCSNGYLLECLMKWTSYSLTPYGIDSSLKLVRLAKERLPQFEANLVVANAPEWSSPVKFDFVRTDLDGVLEDLQEQYVNRLMYKYIAPNGKLLLVEHRTKKDSQARPWLNEKVSKWGLYIADQKSAFIDGKELTRLLVFVKQAVE